MRKPKRVTFKQALTMMRRHDPQTMEDGFGYLRDQAAEYVDRLIEEYRNEKDVGIRFLLLELLGDSKSEKALPLLAEALTDPLQIIRYWATRGLAKLDTKESRQILWEARFYTFGNEQETEYFRETLASFYPLIAEIDNAEHRK